MSSRVNRSNEFEDQDYYPPPPRRGEDARDFRRPVSPPGRSPPRERERGPPLERERIYEDVRLRDREASRGPPAFLREDGRRPEPGPMVLRKREVETIDRHDTRPRGSPSPPPPMLRRRMSSSPPPRMRRGRSPSPRNGPPPEVEHLRARFVETERVRSPSEVRSRRSPSRGPRFDDRRPRSLSPPEQQRIRTRIIDRSTERDIYTSSSSSPSPPPQRIRGPTLERDVITHYHDIDHGMVQARPPSPQRAPRPRPMPQERTRGMPQERTRADETDIDISLGRNRTEVDVVRRTTRSGSRGGTTYYHDDDLGYERYGRERSSSMRMGPTAPPMDDEAREITSKIDSRGRMGESWGGATKDWTIVDVPPGTERVRMDGKGGGSTDTTWSKYSGVRRTQFIPERDGALVPVRAPEPAPAPLPPTSGRDRLSVSVQSRNTDVDIERTTERRLVSMPPPPQQPMPVTVSTKTDMWTEITKDLVTREAIERLGYPYEESKWHFYIMDYLQFDQVKELTDLTDQIRRSRMRRAQKPREVSKHHDDIDVHYHRHRHYYDYPPLPRPHRDHRQHHHHHHGSRSHWDWEAESYREREVIWDSNGRKWYR